MRPSPSSRKVSRAFLGFSSNTSTSNAERAIALSSFSVYNHMSSSSGAKIQKKRPPSNFLTVILYLLIRLYDKVKQKIHNFEGGAGFGVGMIVPPFFGFSFFYDYLCSRIVFFTEYEDEKNSRIIGVADRLSPVSCLRSPQPCGNPTCGDDEGSHRECLTVLDGEDSQSGGRLLW